MLDQWGFLWPAIAGLLLFSLVAGPMGALLIWRRMGHLGDALAHASLLGIAVSLHLQKPVAWGIWLTGVLLCFSFVYLKDVPIDTQLNGWAPMAMSLGIIILSCVSPTGHLLEQVLWGDILTFQAADLLTLAAVVACILILLHYYWHDWVFITLAPELAAAQGKHMARCDGLLYGCFVLLYGALIQLFGVLMLTSLLFLPALAARPFARSPLGMALLASAMTFLSATLGFIASLSYNWPMGPTLVVAAGVTAIASYALKGLPNGLRKNRTQSHSEP